MLVTDPDIDLVRDLLYRRFGHHEFRPYQEAVCRVAAAGRDVLLVMPTGAGKSLCYQLPGVAREDVTLVVSPLIALMEDQVAKLQEQGLRAERVHSGRPREAASRACAEYLAGRLDFLFIAPERLGVAGFMELLARRKPGLIAVDEAHCISHWGHDFRPDYRLLKQRLPPLRPAPLVALTATATPLVQRDIVAQLGMTDARRFIHGFRRDNIAIELAEMKPSVRSAMVETILDPHGRRPALVYAPTRKQAGELADRLAVSFPAAAYHAGMAPEERDEAQSAFLAGKLEIVVATIAFGMGIDKPDIRTVIHTALPGSVEGYYQEVGRAGRDGAPSRAVLLHGYSDRRTHEFFLQRSYPAESNLRRVCAVLEEGQRPKAEVLVESGLEPGDFERALALLRIHGGVVERGGEILERGPQDWAESYRERRAHKERQLLLTWQFASSRECRMLHLVRHFGDQEDSGKPCGRCDICAPTDGVALRLRPPREAESTAMERILDALRRKNGAATGRLHVEAFGASLERREFERLLTALVRAGLIDVREDSFERDGRVIEYRRALLRPAGRDAASVAGVLVASERGTPVASTAKRRAGRKRRKRSPGETGVLAEQGTADLGRAAPPELVTALKEWRIAEALRRKIPAYCILHDKVILAVATALPRDPAALLAIKGIGPVLAREHGEAILGIVRRWVAR